MICLGLDVELEPECQQADNVKPKPLATLRHIDWFASRDGSQHMSNKDVNLFRHSRFKHANRSICYGFADDLALLSVQCLVDAVEHMWVCFRAMKKCVNVGLGNAVIIIDVCHGIS